MHGLSGSIISAQRKCLVRHSTEDLCINQISAESSTYAKVYLLLISPSKTWSLSRRAVRLSTIIDFQIPLHNPTPQFRVKHKFISKQMHYGKCSRLSNFVLKVSGGKYFLNLNNRFSRGILPW